MAFQLGLRDRVRWLVTLFHRAHVSLSLLHSSASHFIFNVLVAVLNIFRILKAVLRTVLNVLHQQQQSSPLQRDAMIATCY